MGRNSLGLGISGLRDEGNALRLLGLGAGLLIPNLLHLEHPLHDKLVFALLVDVALRLTLPGEVELSLPALV